MTTELESLSAAEGLQLRSQPTALVHLRRLRLSSLDPIEPFKVPLLPALTHLFLDDLTQHTPSLDDVFPSLVHLHVVCLNVIFDTPPACRWRIASRVPATIAHFGAESDVFPELLDRLPGLATLSMPYGEPFFAVPLNLPSNLSLVVQRWFAGSKASSGPQALILTKPRKGGTRTLTAQDQAQIQTIKDAGCEVSFG